MAEKQVGELFENRPYMWGWEETSEDGTVTTFVATGEAAVVLPYRYNQETNWYDVVLLRQERPEIGETVLKTVGGYIRKGESPEDCARRNLLQKLCIRTAELVPCGRTQGYTVVEVPIVIYLTDVWEIVGVPTPGCERVEMPLDEAIDLVMRNEVADDSTALPLFRLDHCLRHRSPALSEREIRTP